MFQISLILIFTVAFCASAPLNDDIIQVADFSLKIPQGELSGSKVGTVSSYYSFKGIPYAEPPVGSLRFRSPRPNLGWNGVLDATNHRAECPQNDMLGTRVFGEEDCLFLNVYTPNPNGTYPVMFWIHGGSYRGGSGNDFFYGPQNLVKEDVVLVTINYRLGFLGFFSTGDRHAQGNYGLKDCIEALHWVQDNIHYFGGDRNRVTIFGESAGGSSVNALVLSSATRGLFHRAITESGVLLSPWAFQPNPREVAFNLSQTMNLRATTTEEIVNELRAIKDTDVFVWNTIFMSKYELPRGQHPFQFAPSVEEDYVEPPVITETPLEMLQNGKWAPVPYIIGSNSHEALFIIREVDVLQPDIFDRFAEEPNMYVPPSWNISSGTRESDAIVEDVKKTYFKGEDMKEKLDYAVYTSDMLYHYPTYKTVNMMKKYQTQSPIFSYIFSFSGLLNMPKKLLLVEFYPGAMHSDEIAYLFRVGGFPNPVIPGSPTDKTRQRLVSMWTNFAKQADPTPEINSVIKTKWEPVGDANEYLLIDNELEAKAEYYPERMSMWTRLDKEYGVGY